MAPPTAADPSFLDLGPLGNWELGEARVEPSGLPASMKHRELGLQETPYNRRSLENEASGTHPGEPLGSPPYTSRSFEHEASKSPADRDSGHNTATGLPRQETQQQASREAPGEHFAMEIPWQRGQQEAFRGTGGLQGSSWGAFCQGNPMAKGPTAGL